MPGTPPTTARLSIPRISDGDPVQAATQLNGIADTVDANVAKLAPRVTTLPGSPVDGDECFLVADSTNGVIWRLRYNASSASTYKWEFVGGAALFAEVNTSQNSSVAAYGDLATVGPALTLPTLPNGGDFDVTVGAFIGSTFGEGWISYTVGATAPSNTDAAVFQAPASGTAFNSGTVVRTRRKTAIAGGTAITAKYSATGASVTFLDRFLSIVPVRVG